MSTCKDCLHYDACNAHHSNYDIAEIPDYIPCDNFTDRSEWVHLPCEIGDIFFKPLSWRNTIDKCTVSSLTQKADKSWKIRLTSEIFRSVLEITTNGIGKIVFLTREEAEKALEE